MNVETTLVNPALGEIAKSFPTVDPVVISLVSTLSMGTCLVSSLLILPFLIKVFNKRNIIITALMIYLIGGVSGAFFNSSIYQQLASRVLVGFGAGLTAPLCGAIINELYNGNERDKMLTAVLFRVPNIRSGVGLGYPGDATCSLVGRT